MFHAVPAKLNNKILSVINVTDKLGNISAEYLPLLPQLHSIHRLLRPNLPTIQEKYLYTIKNICRRGKFELALCLDQTNLDKETPNQLNIHHAFVSGLCMYRSYSNSINGQCLRIHDLISKD